ncbi:hypothetical protein JNUCC1_03845 [Lentibacillus sp. JNUCC-1]|uniref:MotE family protein n=1 Tax=Lentibacillus sp. JNUCC-1 TaxID=2654513 RepID=UPI0012E86C9E|nr:hypothetical protein [Lentibacillus sp. JNUCC-1]MUV39961.1 hypothetical protein [Lentibacillus sp. JNUCC-1]
MAKNLNLNGKEKQSSPLIWIVFTIIIPFMAACVLAVIVLGYAGVNVTGWAKEKAEYIPGISAFLAAEEEQAEKEATQNADEIWQKKLANKNEDIKELNQTIQQLQTSNRELEQEIVKLERAQETQPEAVQTGQNKEVFASIAQSFNKMDAAQAALIIDQMDNTLAVELLEQVSTDVRGQILESMKPEQAAQLTKAFVEHKP